MRLSKNSSDILIELLEDSDLKHDLTYRKIAKKLGNRTFGLAILFFALPSALPLSALPGVAFLFSFPILALSMQMVFHKKAPWLPGFIADRHISYKKFHKIIHASLPFLKKIERFLKPRWLFMTSYIISTINGIIIFCLTLLLILPIPFSNFIFAILIVLFSLGLVQKDGVLIAVAYIATSLYSLFMAVLASGIIEAVT